MVNDSGNTIAVEFGTPARRHLLSPERAMGMVTERIAAADYGAATLIAGQLAASLPDDVRAQLLAAESFYMDGRYAAAERYADRALAADSTSLPGVVLKARSLHAQGRHEASLGLLDTALTQLSENSAIASKILNEKATILMDAGDLDAAHAQFSQSVDANKRNIDSLYYLSRFRGRGLPDDLVKWAAFLVDSDQLNPADRILAHFALANEYARRGDTASQFHHLDAGNRIKNDAVSYDAGMHEAEVRQTIRTFSRSLLQMPAAASARDSSVVFIVGMPRSGSTLVEQIISSHPDVTAAGEVPFLKQAIAAFQENHGVAEPYPVWVPRETERLGEISDHYARMMASVAQTPRATDKTLPNYLFVGLIHLAFPRAKIIDVRRHPVDTCLSCYRQLFAGAALPFVYSLDNLAARYRQYRELMAHWHAALPGRLHTLDYEQLVGDPEPVIRRLLDYLELDWDPHCLRFHENRQAVRTQSNTQVREGVYRDAVGRWEESREFLGPLLTLLEPGPENVDT